MFFRRMNRRLVLYLAAASISFTATLLLAPLTRQEEAQPAYAYAQIESANGVELHVAKTLPERIALKAVEGNIMELSEFGINGGFFWQGQLLSIAVMNDRPVKGEPGDYGSGWFNTGHRRGTLVWDGAKQAFSVQHASEASELQVTDRAHYWAQGGISMNLRNEADWRRLAKEENMPALTESRMRTGIVYDRNNAVWLVVTPTACSAEEFRTAILESLGAGRSIVDGVFLDGNGSSQLKVAQASLPGDQRQIYQMIALLH
ncbi:phosphodiester glycosidase family protein [Paenibacillus sp. FJAT-26967]|uniref:phosphodiester glycosidase family protein n=1 Tax=Paenibacillus sp. FJAT-26967 TaxID=1729690 RepID=UPI000A746AA3|nr:phosphodiester glycosidase family protein [Paenibacillus sp. FJAT-26967]